MPEGVATQTIYLCRKPGKMSDQGTVIERPEIEMVTPGAPFSVDSKKELDDLIERGAAVKPKFAPDFVNPGGVSVVTVSNPGTSGNDTTGTGESLDEMTKDELLAEAERRGVDVSSSMLKADVLAALKAAEDTDQSGTSAEGGSE